MFVYIDEQWEISEDELKINKRGYNPNDALRNQVFIGTFNLSVKENYLLSCDDIKCNLMMGDF